MRCKHDTELQLAWRWYLPQSTMACPLRVRADRHSAKAPLAVLTLLFSHSTSSCIHQSPAVAWISRQQEIKSIKSPKFLWEAIVPAECYIYICKYSQLLESFNSHCTGTWNFSDEVSEERHFRRDTLAESLESESDRTSISEVPASHTVSLWKLLSAGEGLTSLANVLAVVLHLNFKVLDCRSHSREQQPRKGSFSWARDLMQFLDTPTDDSLESTSAAR